MTTPYPTTKGPATEPTAAAVGGAGTLLSSGARLAASDGRGAERELRGLAEPPLPGGPPGRPEAERLALEISAKYELGPRLGAGGMGVVYRAHDRSLGRDVALKILSERLSGRPEARERLVREARLAARITSPFVASVFELGATDEGVFIAMELVEGTTLRALLGQGPPPPEQAMSLALGLCEGLAAAHRVGVIHRDLKPENVMVTGAGQPKILDFGLARLDEGADERAEQVSLTRSGALMGTPAYMSPEQLSGDPPDMRSDVYALGLVLYELFAGRRLFSQPTVDELRRAALSFDADRLRGQLEAPPALIEALVGCLAPRERRYRDADEALAVLSEAAGVKARSQASAAPLSPSPSPSPSRPRKGLWLAGLAACIALGLSALWARGRGDEPRKAGEARAAQIIRATTPRPPAEFGHIDQIFLIRRLSPGGWSVNAPVELTQPEHRMRSWYATAQREHDIASITLQEFDDEQAAELSRAALTNETKTYSVKAPHAVLRRGATLLAVGNVSLELSRALLEQIREP